MGRVLFISCTNVGKAMIERLSIDSNIKSSIVGIVNLNEHQGLKKANYQSYLDVSEQYNIPLHLCDSINDESTLTWIRKCQPDVIIQSGWSQKFSKDLLMIPRYACIGEHPSPLPRGRGAACVNWAIIHGEQEWGDSFFKMEERFDEGVLYAQEHFVIDIHDNVKTVYDKVACSAANIIAKWIDKWCNGFYKETEQDNNKATYYKRRRPSDGLFEFNQPAKKIHDFIRAQTYPYPCAFFRTSQEKIKVISSELSPELIDESILPGTVISYSDGGVLIACGNSETIKILRVKPEGKTEMWAEDWIRNGGLQNSSYILRNEL